MLPFFGLVLLAPGYCVGRVADVLGFRRRGGAEQWLWSMALSIVVSPIAINLLSRSLSIEIVLGICWAVAAVAAVDLMLRWRGAGFAVRGRMSRSTAVALGLALVWLLVCLVSLPDVQLGQRLYSTAAVADLGVRSAFTAAAMHGGAPPGNPFFHPGFRVPLRYYYYWYVVAALPGRAAGVAPRAALFASSVWAGWLLAAVVPLALKYLAGVRHNLRRAGVVGIALLAVTGLDCLPVAWLYLRYRMVFSDIEVWDSDEVSSWTNALLWVPHHIAALAVCVIGFVLLWHAVRERLRPELAVLAACAFASAAGLSVYVTFAFGLFLVAASVYWLATGRFRTVAIYAGVGVLVVALSAGYLHDLVSVPAGSSAASGSAGASGGATGGFARIALRQLPPFMVGGVQRAVHYNKIANIAVRPFLLIPVLFVEFGFFALAGGRQAMRDWRLMRPAWKRSSSAPDEVDLRWMLWLMLGTSLWVATMMHSQVIQNNDLAFRGVEVAQFVLLLWGAVQLCGAAPAALATGDEPSRAVRLRGEWGMPRVGWFTALVLGLGLVTAIGQLVMLRIYLWGSDRFGWTNGVIPQSELTPRYGEINYEVRQAYAALAGVLANSAVVNFGASPKLNLQLLYDSRYQQADGMEPGCGTNFGGSPAECRQLEAQLAPIFGTPFPPPLEASDFRALPATPVLHDPAQVTSVCHALGIDALVVTGEDPAWYDPQGWPRQSRPLFRSGFVAAYSCR